MTRADTGSYQSYSEYIDNLARIDEDFGELASFLSEPIDYARDDGIWSECEYRPSHRGGVTIVNFFEKHLEVHQSLFLRDCIEPEQTKISRRLEESPIGCQVRLIFVGYSRNWTSGRYRSLDQKLLDFICLRYQIHPEIVRLHFGCSYGLDSTFRGGLKDEDEELSPLVRNQHTFLQYGEGFLTATYSGSPQCDGIATVVILARNAGVDKAGLCGRVVSLDSNFPTAQRPIDSTALGTNEVYLRYLSELTEQEITYINQNARDCLTIYGLLVVQTEHYWLRFWASKVDPNKLDQNLSVRYSEQRDQLVRIKSNAANVRKLWAENSSTSFPTRYAELLEATETLVNDGKDQLEELQLMMAYRASLASLEESQMSVKQAQQSIQQNQRVKLLTQLAFVFIPLSAVSSLFGMNLTALESGSAKIWEFVVAVVIVYALVLLFWALMSSSVWEAIEAKLLSLWDHRNTKNSESD